MENPSTLPPLPRRRGRIQKLVLILLALLILLVAIDLLILRKNNQTAQNTSNTVSTTSPETSSITENQNTASSSQTTEQQTRDPNRYYNDKDGYSFIVPEGLEAKPASEVYPVDSPASSPNTITISSEFPESVKLGGSDWFPNASITVVDGHPSRTEKTELITINGNNYEYYSTYSPDFDVTNYIYILKLSDREIIISSFIKDIANKLVNSFQLL